ncbi:MAG: PD40 domain-containing protein [Bacteroidetes bacterium]|nr:PD40 domain-containing protein [Bacteroidota bacterium]
MKQRYIFFLLLCSISFSSALKAQDEGDLVILADEMYSFGDKRGAQEVYLEALTVNSDNARANLMTGVCYLETIYKNKAAPYLEKAYQLDPDIRADILLLLGRAFQYQYKFDKAIESYKRYKAKFVDDDKDYDHGDDIIRLIGRKIYECNNGNELVANPVDIAIHNLGHLNSPEPDYAPLISADDNVLIFTSRREGSTGENKDIDNMFFEDIYICYKTGHRWSKPENIGPPINTKFHDASVGLSADGKRLYIYQDNEFGSGGIFYCDLKNNSKWSTPKAVNAINSEYFENSATLSADFKSLYFSSNRPGGYGELDLYVCKRDEKNKWSKPINLGPTINTQYNEDNPVLDIDNKTLYFSSTGHKGMGDYDIFKTIFINEDDGWTEPENLGYPINSPDADIHFVLSGDGRFAYYSSIKDYGVGEQDLFIIKMPERAYEDEVLIKLADITGKTVAELKEDQKIHNQSFVYTAKVDEKVRVKQDLLARMDTYDEDTEGLPQILVDALAGVSFDQSPLFKDTDLDNDHCITTYEIYSMIDIFFDGKTNYSVKQIYRLIDFYFEQDC